MPGKERPRGQRSLPARRILARYLELFRALDLGGPQPLFRIRRSDPWMANAGAGVAAPRRIASDRGELR